MSGGEFRDHDILLGSNSSVSESDLESQGSHKSNRRIEDLLKRLDRGFSGRRLSINRSDWEDHGGDAVLGDGAPPEWALLLVGCLLGLATGLCVAAFNRGVHVIHEWAWAGTPNEGAAWLRLQRLADTWHRILLVPVTGGVIVGMMHGLLEILDQMWEPYVSNDVQVQFYMMSPYVLKTLSTNQKGLYYTSFKVPDVYGVFQFKVEYHRLGYTSLSLAKQIPVRPFRHNEYERFITTAFPYYGASFSTMAGFVIFSFIYLYSK